MEKKGPIQGLSKNINDRYYSISITDVKTIINEVNPMLLLTLLKQLK